MTEPTAKFAIELDERVRSPAEDAASSLDDLQQTIESGTKELREMQKALRQLKGGSSNSGAAMDDLKAQIDAKKESLASARSSWLEMGGTFGKTQDDADETTDALAELTATMAATRGPIGAMTANLASMRGVLLGGAIFGVLTLTSAILSMIKATVSAGIALAKYAIAQSDAGRAERNRLEGLNLLDRARGRHTAAAWQLQQAIDAGTDATNLGRDALTGYARQLARAGAEGDTLRDAVEAAGIAAMVQGDIGAQRFIAQARAASLTGRSVSALADQYRARLGPVAQRTMLSLDNQTTRFRANLEKIFSGLKLDRLLGGLKEIGDLFSQTTSTGRALKQIVEVLFQPMIDGVAEAGPLIKTMFQRMVLGVQNAIIWFQNLKIAVNAVRLEIAGMTGAMRGAVGDSRGGGTAIVDGVLEGLTGGDRRLWQAMRGMADRAADGFRSALGIRSPSRVFAGYGLQITRGIVEGMDSRLVTRATEELADQASAVFRSATPTIQADLADVDASAAGRGSGATQGGPTSVVVGDVHVHVGQDASAREAATSILDELVRQLRGAGLEVAT